MTDRHDFLKVCHVNCQSLYAHLDEFIYFFGRKNYHIICLSETWLRREMPDSMKHLPGYRIVRHDRLGKLGGGVAIYYRESLSLNILELSLAIYYNRAEYIIAEITSKGNTKILLGVVYRPPHCDYLSDFENTFMEIQANYLHSLLFGDFNVDMTADTYDSRQLGAFIESSNLYMVPFNCTHHLKSSSTLLDLCIVDDPDKLIKFGQHDVSFLSAHDLIYVIYKIKIQRSFNRTVNCRDFSKFDEQKFLSEIEEFDWQSLFLMDSMDQKTEFLNSVLLERLNRYAPMRTVCFKNLPAPWITLEIKETIKKRNKARREWRRHRNHTCYEKFKKLRNETQILVRNAKRNFYMATFNGSINSAETWNRLRNLGLVKSKGSNGGLVHTSEQLCVFFGSGFIAGDGANLNLGSVVEEWNWSFDDGNFYSKDVTPESIFKAFGRTKSNAIGADGLSLKIIKLILRSVLPIVEHLFNFSLLYGDFPSIWKQALVCPIPKVGNPTSVDQYRPISILPVMAKALERIASEQIRQYLEENELFDPHQSAYRKGLRKRALYEL